MRIYAVWVTFLCFSIRICTAQDIKARLTIGTSVLQTIDPKQFLSVTLDTSFIRGDFCKINFANAVRLGQFLNPAYLRLGGDDSDHLIYTGPSKPNPESPNTCGIRSSTDGIECNMFAREPFNMSVYQWDRVNWYAQASGLKLIFDFNQALYLDANKLWNSENAKKLLDYSAAMGYEMDFELGNEPDDYPGWFHTNISGKALAENYRRFHALLQTYPIYKNRKIIGPDIGGPWRQLFADFLKAGGGTYLHAVTYHHYYGEGAHTKLEVFTNATIMDQYIRVAQDALDRTHRYGKNVTGKAPEVWLGETATTYDGGTANVSDSYAAGFMWMDKLGLSARMGVKAVFRHTFYHGNYAMLNKDTLPNPDYWLSLIYKQLMGESILSVSVLPSTLYRTQETSNNLRFYAHSARNKTVTIYGMNLNDKTASLYLSEYNGTLTQYLLEPENDILTSKTVLLNGKPLKFDGWNAPTIQGIIIKQPIVLKPLTLGFWTFSL